MVHSVLHNVVLRSYEKTKKKTPKGTTFKMTYTRSVCVRARVCAWVSRFSGHSVIVVILYIST